MHVDLQDLDSSGSIGNSDLDLPVETARTAQSSPSWTAGD